MDRTLASQLTETKNLLVTGSTVTLCDTVGPSVVCHKFRMRKRKESRGRKLLNWLKYER